MAQRDEQLALNLGIGLTRLFGGSGRQGDPFALAKEQRAIERHRMAKEKRGEEFFKFTQDMGEEGASDLASQSNARAKDWANALSGGLTQESHPAVSEMLDFFKVDTSQDLMRIPLEERTAGYQTFLRGHREQVSTQIRESGIPGLVGKYYEGTKASPTFLHATLEATPGGLQTTLTSPGRTLKSTINIEIDDNGNAHGYSANPVGVSRILHSSALMVLGMEGQSSEDVAAAAVIVKTAGPDWQSRFSALEGLQKSIATFTDPKKKQVYRGKAATILGEHAAASATASFNGVTQANRELQDLLSTWTEDSGKLKAEMFSKGGVFASVRTTIESQHSSNVGDIQQAARDFSNEAARFADVVGGTEEVKRITEMHFGNLIAAEDQRFKALIGWHEALAKEDPALARLAEAKLERATSISELDQAKAEFYIKKYKTLSPGDIRTLALEPVVSARARMSIGMRYARRGGMSLPQAMMLGGLSNSIEGHISSKGPTAGKLVDNTLWEAVNSFIPEIRDRIRAVGLEPDEKKKPKLANEILFRYARLENIVRRYPDYFDKSQLKLNEYRNQFVLGVEALGKIVRGSPLWGEKTVEKRLYRDNIEYENDPNKTFKFLRADKAEIARDNERMDAEEREIFTLGAIE